MTQPPFPTNSISRLQELDWDFHGDRSDSPFSDLHFHPGRFVPQIPAALIGTLTSQDGIILDPFCGSGTTLVEAQRLGRAAIGIDLNPVACLVSRVKTLCHSAEEADEQIASILQGLAIHRMEASNRVDFAAPVGVQLEKWYHPETGNQLCGIWNYVCSVEDPQLRDLAMFCFSGSLMSCCGETRTWGYVCDNVRPLEHRYVDAYEVFLGRAEALAEAFRRRQRRRASLHEEALKASTVLEGDATFTLQSLSSDSIDLVVTSPPYFGVVDYIKAQRLTFEWFGLEIEPYRRNEIGARSKRHRGTARMQYLEDLTQTVSEIHRVLRRGHIASFVIGESGKREGTLEAFTRVLNSVGFSIDLDVTRRIGISRRQPSSVTCEQILVCIKR